MFLLYHALIILSLYNNRTVTDIAGVEQWISRRIYGQKLVGKRHIILSTGSCITYMISLFYLHHETSVAELVLNTKYIFLYMKTIWQMSILPFTLVPSSRRLVKLLRWPSRPSWLSITSSAELNGVIIGAFFFLFAKRMIQYVQSSSAFPKLKVVYNLHVNIPS